ncbi:MAG TPA: 3-oxo-tetronate kinase [Burkholderiaceae bacterium]|nr:3-oxo-tetronate kinase [Burkholderiaceae bacterium]
MLLGCIADDFTGASDLANTLVRQGMRTVQTIGVPPPDLRLDADAVVIALKSRSIEPADAVAQSLAALAWLRGEGARQILFKYCSTFDSTPRGNIGPVAQALLEALDASIAIACPAFPTNRRTVYQGHLFVGDKLLNESGMEKHPLTPMTDANLVRWLQRQTQFPVGLLAHGVVARGSAAIADELQRLSEAGVRLAIADAIADVDLRALGEACAGAALITGGSGIALGLPENFRRAGLLRRAEQPLPALGGRAAVLSGSCSAATRRQVDVYRQRAPSRLIAAEPLLSGELDAAAIADWVLQQAPEPAPLVYSSADPETVGAAQRRFGADAVANAIERFFGELARRLHAAGVSRQIVAGGETSGAVVQALGLKALAIGDEIDPGVPALAGIDLAVALALKSGNFGADDFFEKALRKVR